MLSWPGEAGKHSLASQPSLVYLERSCLKETKAKNNMDCTLGMAFEAVWLSFDFYTNVYTLEPSLTNIRVHTHTHTHTKVKPTFTTVN